MANEKSFSSTNNASSSTTQSHRSLLKSKLKSPSLPPMNETPTSAIISKASAITSTSAATNPITPQNKKTKSNALNTPQNDSPTPTPTTRTLSNKDSLTPHSNTPILSTQDREARRSKRAKIVADNELDVIKALQLSAVMYQQQSLTDEFSETPLLSDAKTSVNRMDVELQNDDVGPDGQADTEDTPSSPSKSDPRHSSSSSSTSASLQVCHSPENLTKSKSEDTKPSLKKSKKQSQNLKREPDEDHSDVRSGDRAHILLGLSQLVPSESLFLDNNDEYIQYMKKNRKLLK